MILMKGDAIELDLYTGLGSSKIELSNSDEVKKFIYDLIGFLLDQINKGYGDFAQEDKKSETLKFYRKMQELHLKLSKCGKNDVDVVSHLDNIALEINKFIKVLEKQKSRPFGKSLLANKTSIEELKSLSEILRGSRTAFMNSCTVAKSDPTKTKDIKLNLSACCINRIKEAKNMGDIGRLEDLLGELLKEIDKGYGNIAQENKKSETLKFYREIQKLYHKVSRLKPIDCDTVSHTSEELKAVVAVIDETALEINKFIKVLEKQKSRPSGKSKLANKESIATLKDISGALKTARNLKWKDDSELRKIYKKTLESMDKALAELMNMSFATEDYANQLLNVDRMLYRELIIKAMELSSSLMAFTNRLRAKLKETEK